MMDNANEIQSWLRDLPIDTEGRAADEACNEFSQVQRPVVTVFGSYDSGKSSLIRRLLVDAGQPVPDWLTISARHETFENNTVEYGGSLLRDTPGFAVGATDGRGESNSAQALAALSLTDVAIAVLTPQLVTSDRDLFQALLDRNWPVGSLWFVISRFDEAGGDPENDRTGYEELRDRKITELRELFDLDPAVPIFVVAQDPFQEAGPDDVPAVVWDQYRDWDGMRELSDQLQQLSAASLDQLRGPAATRYWSQAASEALTSLRANLTLCEENSRIATQGATRRKSWESELDVIDSSARASLDGLVESVVNTWLAVPGTSHAQVQNEIERTLSQWFTEHDAHLQRLQRSINKSVERDHRQPAWSQFASLVHGLQSGTPAAQAGPAFRISADQVDELGQNLINVMRALDKIGVGAGSKTASTKAATGAKSAARAAGNGNAGHGIGKYISAVEAALPIAVFIADQIEHYRANTPPAQGPTPAPTTSQTVIDACTDHATQIWEGLVQNTRDLIESETADQVQIEAELRDTVEQLREAVATGESLLATI